MYRSPNRRSRLNPFGFIGMALLAGGSGVAVAAPPKVVETAPDVQALELVEITIHMADGRVITRIERRYPSRSRALLRTGILPAFSVASSASSQTGEEGVQGATQDLGDEELSEASGTLAAEVIDETPTVSEEAVDASGESDSGSKRTYKKSPRA